MVVLATSWLILGVESNFAPRIAVVPRHDHRRFVNPTSSRQGGGRSRRSSILPSSTSSSNTSDENTVTLASRIKNIKSRIAVDQRGGSSAVAAVKTMTARQMETFR